MNIVILKGRLAQDPQVRQTATGEAYNFNLAVNRRFSRTETGEQQADFFSCVAFGKTAEGLQKCSIGKGTSLLIRGELRNNSYTDKNGQKHTSDQIYVNEFEFCESKSAQTSAPALTTVAATPDPNVRPARAQDMTPAEFKAIDPGLDAELPFF